MSSGGRLRFPMGTGYLRCPLGMAMAVTHNWVSSAESETHNLNNQGLTRISVLASTKETKFGVDLHERTLNNK